MWNGAPGSSTASARSRTDGECLGVGERAVGGRVHVREVDHGPHPGHALGDVERVVDRAELADASHHLDAERDGTVLLLEPLAQRLEPADDVVERLLPVAAEPEAGMDDDHLGAARRCEPGAPVERAERHLRLLLVGVAGEGEERCVDGERDAVLGRELAEALRRNG